MKKRKIKMGEAFVGMKRRGSQLGKGDRSATLSHKDWDYSKHTFLNRTCCLFTQRQRDCGCESGADHIRGKEQSETLE